MPKFRMLAASALAFIGIHSTLASAGVLGQTVLYTGSGGANGVQAVCTTGHDSPNDYDFYYIIYVGCKFEIIDWEDGNLAGFSSSQQTLSIQSPWAPYSTWTYYYAEGNHVLSGAEGNDQLGTDDSCATAAWGACIF